MIRMVLPSKKHIIGDDRSKIFDIIGTEPIISDIALNLGNLGSDTTDFYQNQYQENKRYLGYWIKENYMDSNEAQYINFDGKVQTTKNYWYIKLGGYPEVQFDSMEELAKLVIGEKFENCRDGIKKARIYVPLRKAELSVDSFEESLNKGKLEIINKDTLIFCYLSKFLLHKELEVKDIELAYFYFDKKNAKVYLKLPTKVYEVVETDLFVDENKRRAYFSEVIFSGIPYHDKRPLTRKLNDGTYVIEVFYKQYCDMLQKLQLAMREIQYEISSRPSTDKKDTSTNSHTNIEKDNKSGQVGSCNKGVEGVADVNAQKEKIAVMNSEESTRKQQVIIEFNELNTQLAELNRKLAATLKQSQELADTLEQPQKIKPIKGKAQEVKGMLEDITSGVLGLNKKMSKKLDEIMEQVRDE